MVCLIYVTIIIPVIDDPNSSIIAAISSDQILSTNTLFIFLFIIIGMADGVINRKFSNDKTGLMRKPVLYSQITSMNVTCYAQPNRFTQAVEKVRKGFRRLMSLMQLKKSNKSKDDHVADNPLKRKYNLMIGFWIVLHFLIYGRLVILSNRDQNKGSLEVLFSFFADPSMVRGREWALIRFFYFLCTIYVYLNISQIRYGQELFASDIEPMTLKNQLKHQITDLIPFYREVGVIMDFLANRSALQLTHKLTYNDALYNIKSAQIEEITRKESSFGTKPGIVQKIMVGLIWLLLASLIIFGPLLPFTSLFNGNDPVFIKDASMSVMFADETGQEIGRIFETQTNIQTYDSKVIAPYYEEFNKAFSNTRFTFSENTFQLLTMSKLSETRPSLQDRFFALLSNPNANQSTIFNIVSKGSLVFRLNLLVSFGLIIS